MPYKKLSEYQCKKLFYKDTYFIDYLNTQKLDLSNGKYVIKVDNGTKHRMHRGLVKINQSKEECISWVKERNTNENYIVEKPMKFSKEIYVMFRSGDKYDEIIINEDGGINLDEPEKNATILKVEINSKLENTKNLDENLFTFIEDAYTFYTKYHLVYLEMNPVVLCDDNKFRPLDFAVLMDCDSLYLFSNTEDEEILNMDYYQEEENNETERIISQLDDKTGGSLKFKLLNKNGNVWTLIAGGGASVVYTDAIIERGYLKKLANYGEYSGDPQEELVTLYCNEVFKLMENVIEHKTLFIGGGIANFTDVASTFNGIIKSIHNNTNAFKNTSVWIRRGGPNYIQGLDNMKNVLNKYNIENHVFGPETPITEIVTKALPKLEFEKRTETITSLKFDLKQYLNENINYSFNNTNCIIFGSQFKAAQRMLDFDYLCGKDKPSVVAILDDKISKNKKIPLFWGNEVILLNVYNDIDIIIKEHLFDTVVSFASFRASYDVIMKLLDYYCINKIVIIAEGIPEQFTRKINFKANKLNKLIIGPATVGGIKPKHFRIGNTGGSIENLENSRLLSSGSVALVSRSGGLLNEMCRIISDNTNGVYQAISIGGDRWPGSNFLNFVMDYEKDENVKMIVLLGEIGGIQEILISNAVKEGLIKKPIIGWCMGISASYFDENIQFGHAGSSATVEYESAIYKNKYMNENGIIVPNTFEDLSNTIKNTFDKLKINKTSEEIVTRTISNNRKVPDFFSSISNELGEELKYNNILISDIVKQNLGYTIGNLWFKKEFPEWLSEYIDLIIKITADHGPLVSGAQNTIVSSRAGKDLISSLCSGLLTIGDYFGGALNNSAKQFLHANENNMSPSEFVSYMNKNKSIISGIGHKIKTNENPDKRVVILKEYVFDKFPKTSFTQYALDVEQITLQKRNNLILNVDGFIANSLLDALHYLFSQEEVKEIVDNEFINAFFVLGRTIGFIGHWYDQKRLQQSLYRCNKNNVQYL